MIQRAKRHSNIIMQQTTIIFFIKNDHILLAMKKRGHGVGKWNGVGGKVKDGESIETAAIRESQEEIGVTPLKLTKVAELTFTFPSETGNHGNHTSTVFLCNAWDGEPGESEEMKPEWFPLASIPYEAMWDDDKRWLPKVLSDKKLVATLSSDTNSTADSYTEREVDHF